MSDQPLPESPSDPVVDPDVDLHAPEQRRETRPREWDILIACAVGGVLGAWARYGVSVAVPHDPGRFAWSTLVINVTGCLLIGVLMVVLRELVAAPPRLARPFLGVGVLGGYTTYSTFAVDAVELARAHRLAVAVGYLVATAVLCVVAVWLGVATTRIVGRTR